MDSLLRPTQHCALWFEELVCPHTPCTVHTLAGVTHCLEGTIRLAARRVMFGPRARMASKGDQLRTMCSVGGRCLGRFQVEPGDLKVPLWREIGLSEEERGKKRPLSSYDDDEDVSDEEVRDASGLGLHGGNLPHFEPSKKWKRVHLCQC